MKQYDKIYIPDEDGEFEAVDIDSDTPEKGRLSPQPNIIVTTLEELKELWDAAQDRMNAPQMGYPGDTKIFEAYLESKGIQLP